MKVARLAAKFIFAAVILFYCLPQISLASIQSSSTEETVRAFFKETPVMVEIARCESGLRQSNNNGSVLRGGAGGGMVGVFQIYERVHDTAAANLGFDITTLEGNLGYAKHLYDTQGTTPWNSAKACWGKSFNSVTSAEAERQKKLELIKLIITLLLQLQAQKDTA